MKRIKRLTESDLHRIVKRCINEMDEPMEEEIYGYLDEVHDGLSSADAYISKLNASGALDDNICQWCEQMLDRMRLKISENLNKNGFKEAFL